MRMKTKSLILINIFLFILTIVISFKIFNLAPLGNLILSNLTGQPICKDCNVILVSLDTLSANHLPCYGYGRNTAPNLCKFGQENILFNNAYSNAYFTLPSHTSIFTGLLPSKHKVNMPNFDKLDPNIPFLPQILQQNGYETYFNMITNNYLPVDKVYNRGIDQIVNPNNFSNLWEKGLQKFKENNEKGQKTFLFLHTYYVHTPYLIEDENPTYTRKVFDTIPTDAAHYEACSENFISYLKSSLEVDLTKQFWLDKTSTYQTIYNDLLNATDINKFCDKYHDKLSLYRIGYVYNKNNINTSEKVEYIKDLYDQKIVELDSLLSPLLDLIKQNNIRQNTILIITADHGEEFMEHGEIQHNTLFDSNVRIPLIMYIPGINNNQVNKISQNIDIVPTILDAVGIKLNYSFQGKSLINDIVWGKTSKKYVVAEKMSDGTKTIRDEKYKLFLKQSKNQLQPYLLFDIQNDPSESQNIIFSRADIVNGLKKEIIKMTGILIK